MAIVVCADVAVYESGPARCTGGAGSIAFLLGPNSPLVFEPVRACYSKNIHDFYKPVHGRSSEYPRVFGPISVNAYMEALDKCYIGYIRKFGKLFGKSMLYLYT